MENGYRTFDLGATNADCTDGIFIFKEGFGGQTVPTFSWEKIYSKLTWKLLNTTRAVYSSYRRRRNQPADPSAPEGIIEG